jgi:hypothetical protein
VIAAQHTGSSLPDQTWSSCPLAQGRVAVLLRVVAVTQKAAPSLITSTIWIESPEITDICDYISPLYQDRRRLLRNA